MAQFGIEATQLSAPQGAGTSPVAPVESAMPGIVETLAGTLNIFARGIKDTRKREQDAARSAVISSYTKKLEGLNQGLRTGQLSPTEARSRQMALSSEYMAGYSDYIDDIEKATKAFMGTTELSDAEQQIEDSRSQRQQLIKAAQAAGYEIGTTDTEASTDAKIAAYQAQLRADAEIKAMYQEAEYLRAQGRYDQEVADRKQKEVAQRAIAGIAGANYEVAYQEVNALVGAVQSGRLPANEAQALWGSKMARIHTALVEAARMNPELANTHRGLFERIEKVGNDMLDPGKRSQALKDQLDALLNQAKLSIVQDPRTARIVGASQLFGNNAQLMLQSSAEVSKIIANIIKDGPEASVAPPVIGTADSKAVFKVLREAVAKANTGGYEDKQAASKEISNAASHMLQQFGEAVGKRGFDIKQLNDAADFFSSPEFGKFASENRLDTEAVSAAYKTFQSLYKPTVADAVGKALERVITTGTGLIPARAGSKDVTLTPKTQGLDPNNLIPTFNTTGIVFRIANPSADPVVRQAENAALQELKQAERAITKVIHIGSHLEGTTDYNKFWEANKHELLPMFFSAPEEKQSNKPSKTSNTNVKLNKGERAIVSDMLSLNDEIDPGTPEARARRMEQDIIAIKQELSRKDVGESARKILEKELSNIESELSKLEK